jgi:hypothetical protein
MKPFIHILFIYFFSYSAIAQSTWAIAESIDRTNTWNNAYYKAYNSADKLSALKIDSAAYCFDCSLTGILLKGIEANKIPVYQLDKKSVLSIQKWTNIKSTLQTTITSLDDIETITDAFHLAELVIYRRVTTTNPVSLSELSIEWISINITLDSKTTTLYLRAKESLSFLKTYACSWVHPLNHQLTMPLSEALSQHNYITGSSRIVSPSNLQTTTEFDKSPPTQAKNLINKAPLELLNTNDTLLIRLQAICSADIDNINNRGYYKVHFVDYLLKLYSENKLSGYAYHTDGYFTALNKKGFLSRMLVVSYENDEYTAKRMSPKDLTQLHFIKSYTRVSMSEHIKTDWIILGMPSTLSNAFENNFTIAFSFKDVLDVLKETNLMWYNGTNETDSMRLDEAIRTQRIAYKDMYILSMYGDTISYIKNQTTYTEINSSDNLSTALNIYSPSIITDFDASHKRIMRVSKTNPKTYQLNYTFTATNNSVLTKNTLLIDALLEGIKTNKLKGYTNAFLTEEISSSATLNKLDKARFYQTGNKKKDSIYISKIAIEDRYIQSKQLTEYMLTSLYTTINNKSNNSATALGVFIPADLNPQYEQELFCYISYTAFLHYLKNTKAYKKQAAQLTTLLNEKAITSVEDFYNITIYEVSEENSAVPNDLPTFVRERIVTK